jgi:hypothetical protein
LNSVSQSLVMIPTSILNSLILKFKFKNASSSPYDLLFNLYVENKYCSLCTHQRKTNETHERETGGLPPQMCPPPENAPISSKSKIQPRRRRRRRRRRKKWVVGRIEKAFAA